MVRVQVRCNSACLHSGDHDFVFPENVVLIFRVLYLLENVVGASEVQFFVFVRNGVWSATKIFSAIAIGSKDFGSVVEKRINLWIRRRHTILIKIFERLSIFSSTKTREATLIARLQSVILTSSTTESAAIEVNEEIISILTDALMYVKSNRRAIKTSSTFWLRK